MDKKNKKNLTRIHVVVMTTFYILFTIAIGKFEPWYIGTFLPRLMGPTENSLASTDKLIKKFEQTIFEKDIDAPYYPYKYITYKWHGPIRVKANAPLPETHTAYLKETFTDLSIIIGLNIELLEHTSDAPYNVDLIVTNFPDYEKRLKSYKVTSANIDSYRDSICSVSGYWNRYILIHSSIYISKDLTEQMFMECVLEEFTQGMGLHADSDLIQMSVMTNLRTLYINRLPLNDKIMVRTLYDKRIKPGMTKAEAMPLVRIIIPELVAAVKKHGESALHQKPLKFPMGMEDSST